MPKHKCRFSESSSQLAQHKHSIRYKTDIQLPRQLAPNLSQQSFEPTFHCVAVLGIRATSVFLTGISRYIPKMGSRLFQFPQYLPLPFGFSSRTELLASQSLFAIHTLKANQIGQDWISTFFFLSPSYIYILYATLWGYGIRKDPNSMEFWTLEIV